MPFYYDEETQEKFWFDTDADKQKYQPEVKLVLYQVKDNGDTYSFYDKKVTLIEGQYFFVGSDKPILTNDEIVEQSRMNRDESLESPILYLHEIWDIDENARKNIEVVLRKAERLNVSDTESRPWRLEDNTWRETTLGELKSLLEAYEDRFEDIWSQFTQWDNGSKSEPFVYVKQ